MMGYVEVGGFEETRTRVPLTKPHLPQPDLNEAARAADAAREATEQWVPVG